MEAGAAPGNALGRFARTTHRIVDRIGQVTSVLIFLLIGILLYGVVMRYVMGRPSVWAGELSGLLYAVYFLIGGAYALVHRDHVNVNILRQRLSVRARAAVDLVVWLLFYLFIGVIFWLGIGFAWDSVARLERSSTVWGPYIWPVKLFLPIGAFLMLVVGLAKSLSDVYALITGHSLVDESRDEARPETQLPHDAQH